MSKHLIAGTLLALAIFTVLPAGADSADETAALAAAKKWLAIMDSGRFGSGYDDASTVIKTAFTRKKFEELINTTRGQLGTVRSRVLRSKKYSTSIPGGPDGQYVVIQFDTRFEKKPSAIETITPAKEKNGAWKVSGYYIK
jgi:hypothetical protein